MSSDSGQKFIKRNRPPRVQISYEDPYDAQKKVELPFVMGVMSDLSGNAPGVEKQPLRNREFTNVTAARLDDYMKSVMPGISVLIDNHLDASQGDKIGISATFEKMDDLTPAGIARRVPTLARLLSMRQELAALKWHLNGKPGAADHVKSILSDPSLMAALASRRAAEDEATRKRAERGEVEGQAVPEGE